MIIVEVFGRGGAPRGPPSAPRAGFEAMTILVVSLQHPSAGTSRSRRRTPFIPAPASAGTTSPISPQSGPRLQRQRPSPQSSAASSSQPICAKPSPANAAARPNPHRRPTARRCPAGSFFGGFRTPASAPAHRSRRAGIRNPSRKRSSARDGVSRISPRSVANERVRLEPVRPECTSLRLLQSHVL